MLPFNFEQGEVLLFDKPLKWTSFDVVNLVRNDIRRALDVKIKTGHAGTLDPLATGLLIILTGKKTKLMDSFLACDKEYAGTIYLGETTPGFDREMEPDGFFPVEHITESMILETAKSFLGQQMQIPPIHSAIKTKGKRAYEMARKDIELYLPPRPVIIYEFEVTAISMPKVDFRIVCSKGTYIRSIARDFGLKLNSGGTLDALRRTRIGEARVEDAQSPELFKEILKKFVNYRSTNSDQ